MRFDISNLSLQPSPHRVRQNTQQANAVNTAGQTGVQAEDNNVLLDDNGNAILTE